MFIGKAVINGIEDFPRPWWFMVGVERVDKVFDLILESATSNNLRTLHRQKDYDSSGNLE